MTRQQITSIWVKYFDPFFFHLMPILAVCLTAPFGLVLEYVEGKWVCEGSGPTRGLEESTARKYLRDIVAGLMYLHAHVCH